MTQPAAETAVAPPSVSWAEALRYWFYLGCISFGGPAGQIGLMHEQLVVRRRWIDEGGFQRALALCTLLPGPEAQQLATYLGWRLHGRVGALMAGTLFVLPAWLLLVLLSWVYLRHGQTPWVAGALAGVRPVVVALVAVAALRLARRSLKQRRALGLAAAAFVGVALLGWPFPWLVLAAGVLGAFALRPAAGAAASTPVSADGPVDGAHSAAGEQRRLLHLIGGWLLCWAAPLVAAAAWMGGPAFAAFWGPMARFFTQAAFLSFGGAYAVLPYVHQAAVDGFGWLTAAQMMDGLALGESTPGPLILVVAFVGQVAGWGHALKQGLAPLGTSVAASAWATYYTFLPSFLFILALAPWVAHPFWQRPRLAGALAGVHAAVVGAILALGLLLAQHSFGPLLGTANAALAVSVALCAVAAGALWRGVGGPATWVALGAVAGMAASWIG